MRLWSCDVDACDAHAWWWWAPPASPDPGTKISSGCGTKRYTTNSSSIDNFLNSALRTFQNGSHPVPSSFPARSRPCTRSYINQRSSILTSKSTTSNKYLSSTNKNKTDPKSDRSSITMMMQWAAMAPLLKWLYAMKASYIVREWRRWCKT